LKTSEDLEIYEMDYSTNSQLQEVCEVKQPVLFEFESVYTDIFENLSKEEIFSKYGSYDVKIKDCRDYDQSTDSVDYVVLSLQSSQSLVESDSGSHYFSENNEELVNESGLSSEYKELDTHLKPSFTLQSKYDIMFGSQNTATPLRYHLNYRQFFIVKSGKIHVKMTPMKSKKYLKPIKDYDNYEFRSPVDIWSPQDRYLRDIENIKFLEFEVMEGFILYVPPFWFYSIRFLNGNSKPAIVESYTYNSIMNVASNIPQWSMYYLQNFNTKTKVLPKKELVDLNDNDDMEEPNPATPDVAQDSHGSGPGPVKSEISDFIM